MLGLQESSAMSREATCNDCHHVFVPGTGIDGPCPNCGSQSLTIRLGFSDTVDLNLKDRLDGKVIDPSLSSKKKVRRTFMVGADKRVKDGRWMHKERTLDRDLNQYKERVIDPLTGEVVHHCEEPLSDHTGHGSDKPRKT
jgi:hypothetical protein